MVSTMRILISMLFFPCCFANIFGESCPSTTYKDVKIYWGDYGTFYIKEQQNGTPAGVFPRIMQKALKICCGRLKYAFEKIPLDKITAHNAEDVLNAGNESIVIIFPVLASNSDPSALALFNFIPIKISPGPMVLATKKSMDEAMDSTSLLRLWINPVVYLIVAMCASATVIFWLLEFRDKEKPSHNPFSKFIREMGNSIWFSIVTMTTVGYGDIVPRFPLAKAYAAVWMLTGTILTSLLTAQISSAMTTLLITENQSLLGRKLGVLKGTRMFFENEINFGAIISEYTEDDLMAALKQGNISRALLPDFLEAMYVLSSHKTFFRNHMRIVETIRHPFSVGVNVVTALELDTNFLRCLRISLKSLFIEEDMIDYSAIDSDLIKRYSIEMLTDRLLIRITLFVFIASAGFLVLGVIAWSAGPRFKRRLTTRRGQGASVRKNTQH